MAMLYCILLILLTCMDLYLIGNYQRERHRRKEELLCACAERVGEDLEEINRMLFDIYANNSHFRALGGELTELQEFDEVYELDSGLRNRLALEGKPHGFVIYYHGSESVRYYSNNSLIDSDAMTQIREIGRAQLDTEAENWQWGFFELDGGQYGILAERRNRAAMCMIYSFEPAEQSIRAGMEAEGGEIFFVNAGMILGELPQGLSEDALRRRLRENEVRFQCSGKKRYIYGQKVQNTNLWICMADPVTLWSYMNIPQLLLLLLTASSLAGAYLLYRYVRRELIVPLRDMTTVMKRIQDGEWDAKLDRGTRFEELQKVNTALSVMVSEIKKQKMLFYEQTIERQKAQMQYLQLQLKPHFYLNGLKTLHALAFQGDSEKMQDLIIHLSYHLRYLLQAERELVPLAAEMDYVKNYANLQRTMTGRILSLDWRVQEGMRGWVVPTLCIETFVENSFKYAKVGSIGNELVIQIAVCELDTEDGSFLDICIRDNGAGYPKAILEEINHDPTEGCVSVGINNLKRRCRLLYGDEVQYGFYNEDGAVSELVLPWQRRGEGDEDTDRR